MSLNTFDVIQTFTNVKTHQSVYSDGVKIWTTNAGNSSQKSGLFKYDLEANLLASNIDATDDITGAESDVIQMNGLDLKDGKLYVSAMNYPHGSDWPVGDHNSGHLYQRSYITRWDAETLTYEDKWPVGDSTVSGAISAAKWSEGCAFHRDGDLFVCFHGDPVIERYSLDENGDLVFVARYTLPSVDNANQTWNAKGFEDITFAGDYAYLNRHVATYDLYLYVFKWTGSGFSFVKKELSSQIDVTGYNQGVNIVPGTNIMWWTRRTSASAYGDLGDISKVYVRGFDLYDITNGVIMSDDNAVRFTKSNCVIISK